MKRKGNILILTYWEYDDALIQTYTLPYVRIIRKIIDPDRKIYLVTQEKTNPTRRIIEDGIEHFPLQYYPFGFKAMLVWFFRTLHLCFFIIRKKIKIIHAWCTPAGALGWMLSVLTHRKLIVDSYEPHAEAMVENGTWEKDSFAFRLLFKLEKYQTKRASVLIACTKGMKDYANEKYGSFNAEVHVKPACVDLEKFSLSVIKNQVLLEKLNLAGKDLIVYAGKTGGIYYDKEIFQFFEEVRNKTHKDFYLLLLSALTEEQLQNLIRDTSIPRDKLILKFVPHNEISQYMGLADLALTPVKPVPTKKYCTPIKDGEYWALGLPVIITAGISDDSLIIEEENAGLVINSFNDPLNEDSACQLIKLLDEDKSSLRNRIRKIAEKYRSFEIAEEIYRKIYGSE